MNLQITPIDRFAFRAYRFLNRESGDTVRNISFGWLLSRFVNELSADRSEFAFLQTLADFLKQIFLSSWLDVFTWLAFLIVIFFPIARKLLNRYYQNRQFDRIFASRVRKLRSPDISAFDSFAVDHALTLQISPELHRGWKVQDIRFKHEAVNFAMPENLRHSYEEYFEKNRDKMRFFNDGTKIMLSTNPIAFLESKDVILNTQETLYSEVKFFQENIAPNGSLRTELIRKAYKGIIDFPHAVSLHLIVITSDKKVLITERSHKVSYYPGAWSCSIEEQLSPEDLDKGSKNVLSSAIERALSEELGLGKEKYDPKNFRLLSVFLESDILNIALCCHVTLNITSKDLHDRLLGLPRTDYEFIQWRFLELKQLLAEIFEPTRNYHPTTRYRMLIALVRHSGEPSVAEALRQLTEE